jgi:DNA-binding MarR family transcriptional regulator
MTPRRLREEIQQTRPFDCLEEEVYLEILRTSQVSTRWVVEALRGADLTPAQFNVLRILQGAGAAGLASGRIAERMVNHDPDLTRLLDRLEARGWVEKARDARDRRVVNAKITKTGSEAVAEATRAVRDRLRAAMGGIGAVRLEELADLLESVRGAGASAAASEPVTGSSETKRSNRGGSHGDSSGSRARHGSDRKAGRSDGARAGGEGRARARHDAPSRVRGGAGDGKARHRDRRR